MQLALQKQMIVRYPRAFRRPSARYAEGLRLTAEPAAPIDEWGIECGDGWYVLIDQAAAAVEDSTEKLANAGKTVAIWPRITQVKEKFGVLTIYISGFRSSALSSALTEAERRSSKVCEWCGQPGELRKDDYLRTTCAACEAVRPQRTLDNSDSEKWLAELRVVLSARPDFSSPALMRRLHADLRDEINTLLSGIQPEITLRAAKVTSPMGIPERDLLRALAGGQSIGDFCIAHPDISPGEASIALLRLVLRLEESAQ